VVEALSDSLIVSDDWVRPAALRGELEAAAERGHASRRLWYLWVLEEWLRNERASTTANISNARSGMDQPMARPREATWQ